MGILDGRPVLLTLPVMLHTYVEHREAVVERRAGYELEKAEARAHILEGLVKAQDRIADVIKAGRNSSSRSNLSPFSKVGRRSLALWPSTSQRHSLRP